MAIKTVKEVNTELAKHLDSELDNANNGPSTKMQGDTVKVVGVVLITSGNGCQQELKFTTKDYFDSEAEEEKLDEGEY